MPRKRSSTSAERAPRTVLVIADARIPGARRIGGFTDSAARPAAGGTGNRNHKRNEQYSRFTCTENENLGIKLGNVERRRAPRVPPFVESCVWNGERIGTISRFIQLHYSRELSFICNRFSAYRRVQPSSPSKFRAETKISSRDATR